MFNRQKTCEPSQFVDGVLVGKSYIIAILCVQGECQ